MPSSQTQNAQWKQVCARDADADGLFVYAVKTTGVYCRPSCASRKPKRQNVQFFLLNADAENAGFRPCKRCKPKELSTRQAERLMVEEACRSLETADQDTSLNALASRGGVSPYHFQRCFKKVTGVTPKQYRASVRRARVAEALRQSGTVTDAIYMSGYQSASRFYDDTLRTLGMTPSTFREGANEEVIVYAFAKCWLGIATVGLTRRGVCAIRLNSRASDGASELRSMFPRGVLVRGKGDVETFVQGIVTLIEEPVGCEDLPLDIRGTAFQQRVWRALCDIPIGSTSTYKDVATALGSPKSSRAVAGACAANPVAVLVPCHRVVRADGQLSGYRWGVERKRKLLDREETLAGKR